MSFLNPQLFYILIVPLLLFTFFILRHKDNITQLFSKEVLERLSVGDDSLPLVVRNGLMFVALLLMLIALARPIIDHGARTVEVRGLSAVVALDISGSMRAKDIYPNRLEFAKKKIVSLLEAMPNDEIALVAFAHLPFILAPFSSDKTTLEEIVDGVTDKYINMSSTNFRALGDYVTEILENKKPKILIVFSDGGEKKEVERFAKIVKEQNISLYVVLVGTKAGSPVLDEKGKPLNYKGSIVITQRDDRLGEIAMQSGGAFIVAHAGSQDIENLVATIKAQHISKRSGEVTIYDREELFYYPLALALLLLLFSFSSLPKLGVKNG